MRRFLIVAAVASLVGVARAEEAVSLSPDAIIAARQAGFDLMQGVAGAMKAAVEGGQAVKPLAPGAKAMAAWAAVIPAQFPDGTQAGHETKAKPEIWSDSSGFAKAASNTQAAAEKLAALADADDKAGFAAQFDALGKTCGGCHRNYRVRRD